MNTEEKKKHRKLPRPQVDPEDRLESQTAIKPEDLVELIPEEDPLDTSFLVHAITGD